MNLHKISSRTPHIELQETTCPRMAKRCKGCSSRRPLQMVVCLGVFLFFAFGEIGETKAQESEADVLVAEAFLLKNQGRLEEAHAKLNEALERFPNHVEAALGLS